MKKEQSLYVIKTVILFVAVYGSAPREDEGGKSLALSLQECGKAAGQEGSFGALSQPILYMYLYIRFLSEISLIQDKPSSLSIMSATDRQTDSGVRYSRTGPPWYSPQISVRSGPDKLGSHCHSSHIGR